MLSPFLPFSANAVDAVLGGEGEVQPMPEHARRSTTSTAVRATRSSPATTPARPRGQRRPLVSGTPVAKPTPVFTKLDPAVVDEELARLASDRPEEADAATRRPRRAVDASAGEDPVHAPGVRHRAPSREQRPREAAAEPREAGARRCATSTPTACRAGSTAPRAPIPAWSCTCTAAGSSSTTSTSTTTLARRLANRVRHRGAQRRLPPAARAPVPGRARRRRHACSPGSRPRRGRGARRTDVRPRGQRRRQPRAGRGAAQPRPVPRRSR